MPAATIFFKDLDRSNDMSPENDDLETPFLSDESKSEERASADGAENESHLSQKDLSCFKLTSFLIGMIFGSFLQAFTLGVNLVLLRLWGKEIGTKTKKELLLLGLLLSYGVSLMVFIIAYLMGKLVTIPLRALLNQKGNCNLSNPKTGDDANVGVLYDLGMFIESHFCVGCLAGTGLAWSISDALVGCPVQVAWSLLALVLSLILCRIILSTIDRSHEEDKKKRMNKKNDGSYDHFKMEQ